MSKQSMDWESSVKKGLFTEETFTSDMKKTVLETVDRHPSYFSRQWKSLAGVIVLCAVAAILTMNLSHVNDNTAASTLLDLSEGVTELKLPVLFQPLDARNWEKGQTIHLDAPNILPGLSNKYNPLKNEVNGYIDQIPLSDIQIIDTKQIAGFGTAIHYKLTDDSVTRDEIEGDQGYLGFTVDGISRPDTLFHYGYGHMYDQEFSMTRLFGQEVLKIEQSICRTDGEACVWYVKKNDERTIFSYLNFEAASYEHDLDGDGKEEAIVTPHKLNQIYLFKEQEGQLIWAGVREALKAGQDDIIKFDEASGIFTIYSVHEGEEIAVRAYRYADGENAFVKIVEKD